MKRHKMKVYLFCYYVQQTKLFCQIVIKVSKYLLSISVTNLVTSFWAMTSAQTPLGGGQCCCAAAALSSSHLSSSSPHRHRGFSFPLTYQNKFISPILK